MKKNKYVYYSSKGSNNLTKISSDSYFNNVDTFKKHLKDKAFLDDILYLDDKMRESRKSIEEVKSESIKKMLYTNMKIPEIWKKNLNFNNTFSKILNKDQNFKEYYKNIILSESFNSKITKENHKIVRETSLPQIIHKRKAIKKNFNELTSSARSTLSLNQNLTTSYLTNSSFQNKTSFTQEFNQSDKKEKLIDPKINKKTRNNDLLVLF